MKLRHLLATPSLLAIALSPSVWAGDSIGDRCTQAQLAGKSAGELKLLRNEVYARHGRRFKDSTLNDYFTSQDWYRPDPAYSDAQLTPTDQRCIALTKKLEDAAGEQQRALASSRHLEDVRNAGQYQTLSDAHWAALAKNGFVVSPAPHEQLFQVYEMNDYLNVPSFITPDPILQLYHLFFDMTLRQVESEKLSGKLKSMLKTLAGAQARVASTARQPTVRAAAEHNLAYLAVLASLLKEKSPEVPGSLKPAVDKELKLIAAHAGKQASPVLNVEVDYSQFVPRGHYTRTDTLRRYFSAMMWLGKTPFLMGRPELLMQILVLSHGLRESGADKDWRAIYDVTAFYVGIADEPSPDDVLAVVALVFGTVKAPDDFAEAAKLAEVKKQLEKRFHPRIETGEKPSVRLLGQRAIPDSEILQRLTVHPLRTFPNGLDIPAALGSKRARSILLDRLGTAKNWPEYTSKLDALTKEFAQLGDKEWKQNLYYAWIWVLKTLAVEPPPAKAPAFMQSPAWADKNLATTLGSWAELRHDTILYAKQSGAECGGGDDPPVPEGYVEPEVLFYERMLALLELSQAGLRRHDALPKSLEPAFKGLSELCIFLKRISEKELAGTAISRTELEQIKIFGANIERLSLDFMAPGATNWSDIPSETDKHMAVIADLHTGPGDVLEVGVGPAYEILVLVPRRAGGRLLARGAVFSYFEFLHPMSDRLTDEKWQQMLKGGKAPSLPVWTDEFLVPAPMPAPTPGAKGYSSGC